MAKYLLIYRVHDRYGSGSANIEEFKAASSAKAKLEAIRKLKTTRPVAMQSNMIEWKLYNIHRVC